MTYTQIMKSSSCRDLMKEDLASSEHKASKGKNLGHRKNSASHKASTHKSSSKQKSSAKKKTASH